jgi:hypothetical protein
VADPKGTYYSPQGSETGWATVIPQRPRSNFFRQMSQYPMAQAKAKAAEEQLKGKALSKLTGNDIGRFHTDVYQKEAESLIENAGNMSLPEIEKAVLKLDVLGQASKIVEKTYDNDIKWANEKNNPVNPDAFTANYVKKYYSNPSADTANEWTVNPPDRTFFLKEDGGSANIIAGKAIKNVISQRFDGYLTDQQWKRSGWEGAPMGHQVANLLTNTRKVNAFSTVEKNAAGENEIVMKAPQDLIAENILADFMGDPFVARVLMDEAKKKIMADRGLTEVDDTDVSRLDLAEALQQQLVPYIDGAIKEAGMSIVIRPPGSGGSGKDQKWQQGFELWLKQLSEGSVAALRFPMGGKIGSSQEEVVAFDAILPMATTQAGVKGPKTYTQIFDSPATVRKAFEGKDWFKALTAAQKEEIVNNTMISGKQAGESATALYTYVTRVPSAKNANQPIIAGQPMPVQGYEYQVRVFDPVTDRSTLSLLYDSGRGARGNTDYNTIVAGGQQGYEYQGAAPAAWTPPKAAAAPAATKPKGM